MYKETLKFEELEDHEWLEDPRQFEYVRKTEGVSCSPNYRGQMTRSYRRIGFGPSRYSGNKIWKRWIYYLKNYDRGQPKEHPNYAPGKMSPCEAVKIV